MPVLIEQRESLIPVLVEWPADMWGGQLPSVGARYALEVYEVRFLDDGRIATKLRPVRIDGKGG